MMDRLVFNPIPLKFDTEEVLKMNRIRPDSSFHGQMLDAIKVAEREMRCKAVIKWVNVDRVEGETVTIDGVTFTSKVMVDNLKDVKKVFLYVMTIGTEIDDNTEIERKPIKDMIKVAGLFYTGKYVHEYINKTFGYDGLAFMTPGSLPDWPIINNDAIFERIGSVTEDIGVILNDNHYMTPWNTTSGILFSNGSSYFNCRLCKNLTCVGRQVAFDQTEYDRIFA